MTKYWNLLWFYFYLYACLLYSYNYWKLIYIYMIEQVPSYVLMGIPHGTASPAEPLLLTPMGEACLRMDLTAIHEILEKAGYKDDEGIANEVNF